MRELSALARVYVLAVLLLGAGLLLWALPWLPKGREQWLIFIVLAALASAAELTPMLRPRDQTQKVTLVFVYAGLLLLPPGGLALLIALSSAFGLVRFRLRWQAHLFNIASLSIAAFPAWGCYQLIQWSTPSEVASISTFLAAMLSVLVFTLVHHLLLAARLTLVCGQRLRRTQLFELDSLLLQASLATLGVIVAILCQLNLWLLGLAAAPLYLVYRALETPDLREQARTDAKTGLYNSRHFYQVLRKEVERASRLNRPLSVIVADMDLLRNINNTYGHLAGDAVIAGVASIIRSGLREYDVASRFGGEEFALMLPECDASQALVVAERIRHQVECAEYVVSTSPEPIRTTISLGVASMPAHGREASEVIHQADLAVYYAKLRGRNRCWACSPESMALGPALLGPHSLGLSLEAIALERCNARFAQPSKTAR